MQPHPHSKMVLWDYPKGKTMLSMNAGESKTFIFTILFLDGTLDTATYELYNNNSMVDSGNMSGISGYLTITLSDLTRGGYWLYTKYTTSKNEVIKDTWYVLVS